MGISARRLTRRKRLETTTPSMRLSRLAGATVLGSTHYHIPENNVFYVATMGSDTNGTGSFNNPYASFKKAAAMAVANATIIIRGGEYHEGGAWWRREDLVAQGNATLAGVIFANNGVTVQNYPGETVWFDGSEIVTGWTFDGTNWRLPFVTKFDRTPTHTRGDTTNSWPGGGGFVNPAHPAAVYAEQLFMNGTPLTQVESLSKLDAGRFYVEGTIYGGTSVNKNVFITTHYVMRDDPTGHETRITTLSRLATVNKAAITMRGIGVRRYSPALVDFGAIYIGSRMTAPNVLLENMVVEDSANLGIEFGSNSGTIRYCTVQRCGQLGVSANADNAIYEYNLIRYNMCARYNYGPNGGGIEAGRVWNCTFRHNKFVDNYGHSLWFDQSCYNNLIHGNDFIRS